MQRVLIEEVLNKAWETNCLAWAKPGKVFQAHKTLCAN